MGNLPTILRPHKVLKNPIFVSIFSLFQKPAMINQSARFEHGKFRERHFREKVELSKYDVDSFSLFDEYRSPWSSIGRGAADSASEIAGSITDGISRSGRD
jgi:hypothetical protein